MSGATVLAATSSGFLSHPLLVARGVAHGFGLRSSPAVPGLLRPRQVHGNAVVAVSGPTSGELGEADAVICTAPLTPVGIVTADCVPVLVISGDGTVVAAIHAGWRGLACGVLPAALARLAAACGDASGSAPRGATAVVGPHIGACCYEVDDPVLQKLEARFAAALDDASTPSRPGHVRLDLGNLARSELLRAGIAPEAMGSLADTDSDAACTRCAPTRFHSYRRDGPQAGRLLHWIAPPGRAPESGS